MMGDGLARILGPVNSRPVILGPVEDDGGKGDGVGGGLRGEDGQGGCGAGRMSQTTRTLLPGRQIFVAVRCWKARGTK